MTLKTTRHSYSVDFCTLDTVLEGIPENVRIITDTNLALAYGPLLAGRQTAVVEAGEASKSLAEFGRLCSWLASTDTTRDTTVVALGGGVIGDLAGFVAASYMRGVRLLMVPTSLMAMVDSSVGGKVAIDLPEGKNLVGAFWPPVGVRIAVDFLQTLPEREMMCGAAEVWKYGLILDAALLSSLEAEPVRLEGDLAARILRCIELKASVVEEDEFETTGRRAVLNFGHTVGHAIESAQGYQGLKHGEAVAVGMVVEARLGELTGHTAPGTSARARDGLVSQGLPVRVPADVSKDALLAYMRRDKKATGAGLTFSLVTKPGECKLVRGVEGSSVLEALAET